MNINNNNKLMLQESLDKIKPKLRFFLISQTNLVSKIIVDKLIILICNTKYYHFLIRKVSDSKRQKSQAGERKIPISIQSITKTAETVSPRTIGLEHIKKLINQPTFLHYIQKQLIKFSQVTSKPITQIVNINQRLI
ncbi:unnamed protein product [Paramecium sonneborni]|uniref:Uncharacterized protein n=1 Tax=Paramecium sonneborni TaxID=65129 RepID=A0A8S1JY38_9CILI|nr:unnamed protein product [Paramecium sonneborni]